MMEINNVMFVSIIGWVIIGIISAICGVFLWILFSTTLTKFLEKLYLPLEKAERIADIIGLLLGFAYSLTTIIEAWIYEWNILLFIQTASTILSLAWILVVFLVIESCIIAFIELTRKESTKEK